MIEDPYTYPGSSLLRNRLDIRDVDKLDAIERRFAGQRKMQGVPSGDFDLDHLCAIHRHLFQDVYDWAGEIRTLEISKGGSQFQFSRFIETGIADVHRRLENADFLHGLERKAFAEAAGAIMGDVNYVHPFREGNGRTQLCYLEQLAEQAGHPLTIASLDPKRWIEASRAAHQGDYGPMALEIGSILLERRYERSR